MCLKPLIWPDSPCGFDHNGLALLLLTLPANVIRADARMLARDVLKKALVCLLPDKHIELFETLQGPRFTQSGLHASLSYAGDQALIGISSGKKLGVDIVRIDALPEIEALSRLYLPADNSAMSDADFALAWAKLEACCKALNLPLAEIDETRIKAYASCNLIDCAQIDGYRMAVALHTRSEQFLSSSPTL